MNTDPGSWDIYKKMKIGGTEPWQARSEGGRLKKYMKQVRPGHRGLCFQTHGASKLVAELEILSGLKMIKGEEAIEVKLVRFLKPPVAWFTIEAAAIIPNNGILRRQTLHPLRAHQFERLLKLSGPSGVRATVAGDIASLRFEENRKEGGLKGRYINYYERNAGLRADAIIHHKTVCQVCGFDYEERYGEHGAGYIEVHHLKPVSTLKKATKIDPKKDMAVVCANCHRMIHRKRDHILSLPELRKIYFGRLGRSKSDAQKAR